MLLGALRSCFCFPAFPRSLRRVESSLLCLGWSLVSWRRSQNGYFFCLPNIPSSNLSWGVISNTGLFARSAVSTDLIHDCGCGRPRNQPPRGAVHGLPGMRPAREPDGVLSAGPTLQPLTPQGNFCFCVKSQGYPGVCTMCCLLLVRSSSDMSR